MPTIDSNAKIACLNETMRYLFWNANDGDKTFSADGTFPRLVMYYNNLTINAGKVVTPLTTNSNAGRNQIVCVKGTLTFGDSASQIKTDGSGTTSGYGAGGGNAVSGSGTGGQGGGSVLIVASAISGTGLITANGANAGNGGAPTGAVSGGTGTTIPGMRDSSTINTAIVPTITAGGTRRSEARKPSTWLPNYLDVEISTIYGGGGGSGAADNDAATGTGGGGSYGGIGVGADGGNGGAPTGSAVTDTGSGGGGGGGGGFVYLMCLGAIPAITIQAKGGNGGTRNGTGGDGGGGGGGLIIVVSGGTDSSTKTVSGGTVGTNGSPVAGTNGVALSFTFNSFEDLVRLRG